MKNMKKRSEYFYEIIIAILIVLAIASQFIDNGAIKPFRSPTTPSQMRHSPKATTAPNYNYLNL